MNRRLTTVIATAAAALAIGAAGTGYALAAATQGGPPVNQVPGPYFQQGAAVNLCLSDSNESVAYAERHTVKLGNCGPGYTQLTVEAAPSAIPTGS